MRTKRVLLDGWGYLILAGTTVPITLGIGFLAMNRPEVVRELAFLLAVYASVMILGLYTAAASGETQETMPEIIAEALTTQGNVPGIEWIDEVQRAPPVPVAMRVVKVSGACALGFLPGDKWTVGADGKLSRPICAAAAKAFDALEDDAWESGLLPEITCVCPLAVPEVTFALEAKV